MEYKRFIVFVMRDYYPIGGMNDATDSCDTKEEAVEIAERALNNSRLCAQSCHIFDCETRTKVWGKALSTSFVDE